jgi:hypothetical protein
LYDHAALFDASESAVTEDAAEVDDAELLLSEDVEDEACSAASSGSVLGSLLPDALAA